MRKITVGGKTSTVPFREGGWSIRAFVPGADTETGFQVVGKTDANGHFKVALLPGSYRLEVAENNSASHYKSRFSSSSWLSVGAHSYTHSDIVMGELLQIPDGGVFGHVALPRERRRAIEKCNLTAPRLNPQELNGLLDAHRWSVHATYVGPAQSESGTSEPAWWINCDATLDVRGNFNMLLPPGEYRLELFSYATSGYKVNSGFSLTPQGRPCRVARTGFVRADLMPDPQVQEMEESVPFSS